MRTEALPRRASLLAALAACSLFCVALVVFRMWYTERITYSLFLWNLLLAWMPVFLSMFVVDHTRPHHHTMRKVVAWCIGVAWLLFYPNAAYILTDFIHLQQRPGVPLWFDIVLIGSCSWTGLMLGFVSLFWIQQVLSEQLGATYAWIIVVVLQFLTGFGVYLGRYARWNSWDIVSDPLAVLVDAWARLSDPVLHSPSWTMPAVLGMFLSLGYVVVFLLMSPHHVHRR